MDEVINSSDLTDPEAAKVFRAAEGLYTKWCSEHNLKVVPVAKMTIDPKARTYALYDRTGGGITQGKVDDLRAPLGLDPAVD
jgi:hypothetical protein